MLRADWLTVCGAVSIVDMAGTLRCLCHCFLCSLKDIAWYLYLFEFVWRRNHRQTFDDILAAMARNYGEDLPVGDSRQEFLDMMMAAAEENE